MEGCHYCVLTVTIFIGFIYLNTEDLGKDEEMDVFSMTVIVLMLMMINEAVCQ
jgi:hypothetical protein